MWFMSQILVRPEQKTKKLSEIIRGFICPQIKGQLSDGKGGYCVAGAIFHHFGWDGNEEKIFGTDEYTKAEEFLHNTIGFAICDLIVMNNSGSSFEEIADYVETIEK